MRGELRQKHKKNYFDKKTEEVELPTLLIPSQHPNLDISL